MSNKFHPGQIVATPESLAALERYGKGVQELLRRHLSGGWGDLCEEDRRLNEEALVDGSRLFSSYKIDDLTIWIITVAAGDDGRRASTCLLLPEEY